MKEMERADEVEASRLASLAAMDSPVGVRKTVPPHPSASKLCSPAGGAPGGGAGSSRAVMAWIPWSVPARMRRSFSGSGGSVPVVRSDPMHHE